MSSMPLASVKTSLSSVVADVQGTHERVTITKNGRPAAVLIAAEDLAALEETLDVLGSSVTLAALGEGRADVAEGRVLDEAELLEYLSSVGRPAPQTSKPSSPRAAS